MELIAYLAIHEEGTANERLAVAIHPEMAATGPYVTTFTTELAVARQSLGISTAGREHLPPPSAPAATSSLRPSSVTSPSSNVRVAAEIAATDSERIRLLTAGLGLVGDGPPLADIRRATRAGRRQARNNPDRPTSGAGQHWQWFEQELATDVVETMFRDRDGHPSRTDRHRCRPHARRALPRSRARHRSGHGRPKGLNP